MPTVPDHAAHAADNLSGQPPRQAAPELARAGLAAARNDQQRAMFVASTQSMVSSNILGSLSWKVTRPLRALAALRRRPRYTLASASLWGISAGATADTLEAMNDQALIVWTGPFAAGRYGLQGTYESAAGAALHLLMDSGSGLMAAERELLAPRGQAWLDRVIIVPRHTRLIALEIAVPGSVTLRDLLFHRL